MWIKAQSGTLANLAVASCVYIRKPNREGDQYKVNAGFGPATDYGPDDIVLGTYRTAKEAEGVLNAINISIIKAKSLPTIVE